ncbi:MAG: hypothetical protein US50_C0039G0015 [Candidatus Nomurabacteria bacterium GW2011_GWB1_37_5]|uniref:Uncharacterized protein n=1 Tax=Candidatus Nomurabacteria bacterium GW2011_GWB1_37_5 TaxID=1618742 RepID=A0A0G0JD59_9BACT|nr:MAG: hypothetical protein US50_C0039G0015 [Candidatus Nomurabacteria bacterium GW2011_GWB1_37_5]
MVEPENKEIILNAEDKKALDYAEAYMKLMELSNKIKTNPSFKKEEFDEQYFPLMEIVMPEIKTASKEAREQSRDAFYDASKNK